MTRSTFFKSLLAGLLGAPAVVRGIMKTEQPELGMNVKPRSGLVQTRPGARMLCEIPKEAGGFLGVRIDERKRLIVACENGVWVSEPPYEKMSKDDGWFPMIRGYPPLDTKYAHIRLK